MYEDYCETCNSRGYTEDGFDFDTGLYLFEEDCLACDPVRIEASFQQHLVELAEYERAIAV